MRVVGVSRTRKGRKAPGYEHMGRRQEGASKVSCLHPTKFAKRLTHQQERRALDRSLRRELAEALA